MYDASSHAVVAAQVTGGDERTITLVEMAGKKIVRGLNNLTNGDMTSADVKKKALTQAKAQQFKGAAE